MMIDTQLLEFRNNKDTFNTLVEKFRDSRATNDIGIVPFIGAGLSAFCYPGWYSVLVHLNKMLGAKSQDAISKQIDSGNYEKAANMLAESNESLFYKELRKIFGIKPLLPFLLSIHKQAIGVLPFLFPSSLILTSNFDGVIEAAYDSVMHHMPSFELVTQDVFSDPTLLNKTNNRGILFKVHGDIFSGDENIIISEAAYNRHYGDQTNLVKNLSRLFKEKSILFLGSSIGTDRFLNIIATTKNEQRHFAIVECDWNDSDFQALREKQLTDMGIYPIFYPKGEYHSVQILLNRLVVDLNPSGIIQGKFGSSFYRCGNFVTRVDSINDEEKKKSELHAYYKQFSEEELQESVQNVIAMTYMLLLNKIFAHEIIEEMAGKLLSLIRCCFLKIIDDRNYEPLVEALKLLSYDSKDEYARKCYAESITWRDDLFRLEPLERTLAELKTLCEMFSDDQSLSYEPRFFITRFYAYLLARLAGIYAWNDINKTRQLTKELEHIYNSFSTIDFAIPYAEALHNEHLGELQMANGQFPDKCYRISSTLFDICKKHNMAEALLNMYGRVLINEILVADLDYATKIVNSALDLLRDIRTNQCALICAKGLQSLSLKYDNDIVNREKVLNILYQIHKEYPDDLEIDDAFRRAFDALNQKLRDETSSK